jgi:alpha-L-fucosidase 2
MKTKVLHFDKTIMHWDEALPLGNGDLGCLIWNSSDKLRFSLDKGGIWDCSKSPENQNNFTYNDIKNLVANKKQKQIQKNMMIVTAIRHQPNCRQAKLF